VRRQVSSLQTAADSTSVAQKSSTSTTTKSLLSAALLVGLDAAFSRLFQTVGIAFPSSLAGCGILLAALLVCGDGLYDKLSPGADLLAKWLPVFFVPSLIALPLAAMPAQSELLKLGVVIVGGFVFTLLSTAYAVVATRKICEWLVPSTTGSSNTTSLQSEATEPADELTRRAATAVMYAQRKHTEYRKRLRQWKTQKLQSSGTLYSFHLLATFLAGSLAIYTNQMKSQYASISATAFLLASTLTSYAFGTRAPRRFKQVVPPIVTCTVTVWAVAMALARASKTSFTNVLSAYRTGSSCPLHIGAGDVLLRLLGPAVVSLACSMYSRRKLVRDNLPEIATAVSVSTVGGLFGTAFAVRMLNLASPYLRLSLLSRNITSPLALAIASILGADVSFAVTIVVLTGLFGATFGARILDACGIRDNVARGLSLGASAHGLGTAALNNEPEAFPFAGIAMALTASAATIVVHVPVLKKLLLQIALG
jgi:putative effector of murein hydrolase